MTVALPEEQETFGILQALKNEGAVDAVSLTLTDSDITYERWEALGRYFGDITKSTMWWIGDWLIFGEAIFHEDHAQAIESSRKDRYSEVERVTGLAHGTLMNVRSVCDRIKKPQRRAILDFWVHEPVAKLDADDQDLWLDKAIKDGLGRDELRKAIRDWLNPPIEGEAEEVADEPAPPSKCEKVDTAARLVSSQAMNNSDGEWVVPDPAMVQLRAALGEE